MASGSLTGTLGTFAGVQSGGSFAGDGGKATSASFYMPTAIWSNTVGIVYVVDQMNFKIRKIDKTGIISTIFGASDVHSLGENGAATAAGGCPVGLNGDTTGTLYVVDSCNYRVRKIDSTNKVTTYGGGGSSISDNIRATAFSFAGPSSAVVDSVGNVYVSDWVANKIKKIAKSNQLISNSAGTGSFDNPNPSNGIAATAAGFNSPYGSFLSPNNNNLYTSEMTGGFVRRIDLTTGIVNQFAGCYGINVAGNGGSATSALLRSNGLAVASDTVGNVFIATMDSSIRIVDSSGIINMFAGSANGATGSTGDGSAATAGLLNGPRNLYYNGGVLYIPEQGNNKVRTVSLSYTPAAAVPSLRPTAAPSLVPSATTGGVDVTGAVIGVFIAVGFIALALKVIFTRPKEKPARSVEFA